MGEYMLTLIASPILFAAVAPMSLTVEAGDSRTASSCTAASSFLREVLPPLVQKGDTVIDAAPPIPIDIAGSEKDGVKSGGPPPVRRLTADSNFWKIFYNDNNRPSPLLINSWFHVQRFNAVNCVRPYLINRGLSIRSPADRVGHRKSRTASAIVSIGYPAFDRTGTGALLYFDREVGLSGESQMLRYALVDGRWKLIKSVKMSVG